MRKALKFTKITKKEYTDKPVTVENCTSVKFIHILLFKAESHWAYGMQRKMLLQQEDHADNNRIKFHFKKRFRLAWIAAQQL